MKRTTEDAIISDLVRERADWTCERCKKEFPERKGRDVHCSHIYGRGTGNIPRYDTENCRCLCATCHNWIESRPIEHHEFVQTILTEDRIEALRARCARTHKWEHDDKTNMRHYYRAELRRLRNMRLDGVKGYIPIKNWFGDGLC